MLSLKAFDDRVRTAIIGIFKPNSELPKGTGFFVKPNFCLTCYHVIETLLDRDLSAGIDVKYRGKDAKAYYCEKKSNPEKDIAVLKMEVSEAETLPLARECERSIGRKSRAYGYRHGFPDGFPAEGILGTTVPLPLRKESPKGNPEERTSEEKASNENEDHAITHVMTTGLQAGTTLAGMSGSPVYSMRSRKVIGILRAEEPAGAGVTYVTPIDTAYEKWPGLRPSWWRDKVYGTLVATEKLEESPWLFIFLFLITFPFAFNIWLHSTFDVNLVLLFLAAIPLFITFVWVIFRTLPEDSLGKLKFLLRPFRIRHYLRIYSIALALVSFAGFVDGLPALSVSLFDWVYSAFDWVYPAAYQLSRGVNLAFNIPDSSSSGNGHDMVHIPAGFFQQGLTKEQQNKLIELIAEHETVKIRRKPINQLKSEFRSEKSSGRPIWLNDYCIGKFEVTNAQYYEFVKSNPEGIPENWEQKWIKEGIPKAESELPVLVTWDQARQYCDWLNERPESKGAKYRLPTEAEWEKAARGKERKTRSMIFPWGDDWDENRAVFSVTHPDDWDEKGPLVRVNRCSNGASDPYRCVNMAGNAPEWCWDWYDEYYYDKGCRSNPKGPPEGEARVCRGGGYGSANLYRVRSTARGRVKQENPNMECGFRVVKSFSRF